MNSRLHRGWLWGCFAATLLASLVGGFGVSVTAVFIGIYLTGLVLIGPDEPADTAAVDAEVDAEVDHEADAEPYPDEPDEPDESAAEAAAPSDPDPSGPESAEPAEPDAESPEPESTEPETVTKSGNTDTQIRR